MKMVAIKGMIMPRCCGNCALVRYHDAIGYSCKSKGVEILQDEVLHKRADDCPLVEIEERKVGKWVKKSQYGNDYCSECDYEHCGYGYPKYCPNCGTKMRGSENG